MATQLQQDLTGKVALVTGAAVGIADINLAAAQQTADAIEAAVGRGVLTCIDFGIA